MAPMSTSKARATHRRSSRVWTSCASSARTWSTASSAVMSLSTGRSSATTRSSTCVARISARTVGRPPSGCWSPVRCQWRRSALTSCRWRSSRRGSTWLAAARNRSKSLWSHELRVCTMTESSSVRYQLPDRNLGLDVMRYVIGSVPMRGVVVIGEGEKDEAPMLYNGESVGDGTGPEYDIAVDPVDGTTLLAGGMPNSIAVMAASDRGTMYDPHAVFYMDKLVTGPAAAEVVDLAAPAAHNVAAVAKAMGGRPTDVTVCILNRPRHAELIAEVRAAGARIRLLPDGDVAGGIAAAREGSGIDLLLGAGGTPE